MKFYLIRIVDSILKLPEIVFEIPSHVIASLLPLPISPTVHPVGR